MSGSSFFLIVIKFFTFRAIMTCNIKPSKWGNIDYNSNNQYYDNYDPNPFLFLSRQFICAHHLITVLKLEGKIIRLPQNQFKIAHEKLTLESFEIALSHENSPKNSRLVTKKV